MDPYEGIPRAAPFLPRTPADQNPWYLLATSCGEQIPGAFDQALHKENRRIWNGWAAQAISEDVRAEIASRISVEESELVPWNEKERATVNAFFEVRSSSIPDPRQPVIFEHCKLEGKCHFSQFILLSDFRLNGDIALTNFISSIFFGRSDFSYSIFRGDVNFSGANFAGNAVFSSCHFFEDGIVNFADTKFEKQADFEQAYFEGPTRFGGSILTGASFLGARFHGPASFVKAKFAESALFGGATFFQDAVFNGSVFQANAVFEPYHLLMFPEGPSPMAQQHELAPTTFRGRATFERTHFSSLAAFRHLQTDGLASFNGAQFADVALFDRAVFKFTASFGAVQFSNKAHFFAAHFDGEANFTDSAFTGLANFARAYFEMRADFSECRFERPTSFREAHFRTRFPMFSGAILHQNTAFTAEDEFWPPTIEAAAEESRESLAIIRHAVGKQGLPEEEHYFFRREMAFAARIGGPFRRFPYWAFGVVSDFGNSLARPAIGLSLVGYLGLVAYWNWLAWYAPDDLDFAGPFRTAAGFSIAQLFGFLGFAGSYFGREFLDALPWQLKVLGGLQTAAGVFLLFFLGLGLRNRFRLK